MKSAIKSALSSPVVHLLVRRPPFIYSRDRSALVAFDALDEGSRKTHQDALLDRVLDAAASTGHYAPLLAKAGKEGRFDSLPLLEKAEVAASSGMFARSGWLPASHASTGGTTGIPLQLRRSIASVVFEQATIDHVVATMGQDFATARVAVLRGDTIKAPNDMEPPFWRQVSPQKLLMSAHHLRPATLRLYAGALEAFKPDILYCYPSALDHLVQLARAENVRIPAKLVLTSSEQFPEGLRARAMAVTGAPVLDYYGQAERVAFAWSVEDGVYFFRPDYGRVELLPDGDGNPELIATGLHNRLQPLIRYRTGDLIDPGPVSEPSPAVLQSIMLGTRPFRGVIGRSSEYITTADGQRIIGLNHIPRNVPGASSIQLVQEAPDFVRVTVVPAEGYGEETLAMLEANLAAKIPDTVRIEIITSDAPIRTKGGKAPLFINAMGAERVAQAR